MAITFLFKAKSRKIFCQTAMSFSGDGIHRKCGIYTCSAKPIYHQNPSPPIAKNNLSYFYQQLRYANSLRQLKRQIHNPNMQNSDNVLSERYRTEAFGGERNKSI